MTEERWLRLSDRWTTLLLRLYPPDFREEMGEPFREAYRDRYRAAIRRGGVVLLAATWLRALLDSLRNGAGERLRPAVGWRRTGNWGRDAERAVRRLVRAPVFTGSVIATLTVGLGAFAVVYALVVKVLLVPLPYERPDQLYYVWRDYTWVPFLRGWLGGTDVVALDQAGGVIQGAAALRRNAATLTAGLGGEPEEIGLMVSSPNLFEVLGVRPQLGRGFAPDEVGPGRPPVLVLSHRLWERRFAGDSAIIGRDVRLNGSPYTVIGVMGPDFNFVRHSSLGPPEGADGYTTFDYHLAESDPGSGSFAGIVRMAPGASRTQAAAAVGSVARMVDARDFRSRGLALSIVGMKEDLVAEIRPSLVILGLSGGFLVLVLAVNLGSLLLMRAAQREREFAVSRALGANPTALARATLLEGALLGAAGAVSGTVAAIWGTRLLVALAPLDLPRRETVAVDWSVGAAVVLVGALMGIAAGAAPAIWVVRARLMSLLTNTAVRGGGGHGRARRVMVVAQVALSLLLLSTGGLVARSFEHLLRADPGFEPDGVLTLRVPASQQRYPEAADIVALHQRLVRGLAAIPGVTEAGAVSSLPLSAETDQGPITFPGAPGNSGDAEHDQPLVDLLAATPDYFATAGIELLEGRILQAVRSTGLPEVVIDRTLARKFFPGNSAVGAIALVGGDSAVVVGVVEHARQYDLHRDGRHHVYFGHDVLTAPGMSYLVRSSRAPTSLVAEVRAAVREVDAELAVADVRPMTAVVDEALRQQRLTAVLVAGFSLGALLLAGMGLFGVVAGSVTRRRHELAVRLALGATAGSILRLVLGDGGRLVLMGVIVAVPGVYLVGRFLRRALVGVSAFDPATLALMAAVLGITALVACWLPARRVGGIEPARALREE